MKAALYSVALAFLLSACAVRVVEPPTPRCFLQPYIYCSQLANGDGDL